MIIDTTVQEKNSTFPTDTKLRVEVIARCWKLAATENIRLRRSYQRELKKVLRTIRFSKTVRDKKKITAALRPVKTMANALLRECTRKRSEHCRVARQEERALWSRVVNQERLDKNKIYNLHEPSVSCIGKGKA